MSIHTAAYYGAGLDAESASLDAVIDQILASRNGAHVPSRPLRLVAAGASGGGDSITLVSARIQSPKTVISPAYVRPVNADLGALFPSDPNISMQPTAPIVMREGEEISASVELSGAGDSGFAAILVWFQDLSEPIPAGEAYWVKFTATVPAPSVGRWSNVTLAFADSTTLPAGRYAVVGMHLLQPTAPGLIAGRLVIPGATFRPGTVFSPSGAAITPSFASDGSLGVWATFDAQLPPSLEVLTNSAIAGGAVTGFLKVIQLPG